MVLCYFYTSKHVTRRHLSACSTNLCCCQSYPKICSTTTQAHQKSVENKSSNNNSLPRNLLYTLATVALICDTNAPRAVHSPYVSEVRSTFLTRLNTLGRKQSEYPRKGTLGILTVVNPRWYRIHLTRPYLLLSQTPSFQLAPFQPRGRTQPLAARSPAL